MTNEVLKSSSSVRDGETGGGNVRGSMGTVASSRYVPSKSGRARRGSRCEDVDEGSHDGDGDEWT